jgi:hypothetical protein
MLADSSEAAVRSRKPTKKQDIADTVQQIFETKMRTGQLDESGLTLNDIKAIRKIFIDMLQAVFHPRISYPVPQSGIQKETTSVESPRPARKPEPTPNTLEAVRANPSGDQQPAEGAPSVSVAPPTVEIARPQVETTELPSVKLTFDEGDAPLPDVPPLPRTGDHKAVKTGENGKHPPQSTPSEEQAG